LIVVDTGPLVAAADDHDHARCVAMFAAARRPWLVPQPVIAEVCYLLEREHGSRAEAHTQPARRLAIKAVVSL
jgi:predicted nucleic acid-binding protein